MQVEMLRFRVFQDAGVERRLEVGSVYDLPTVVAQALIATGAATAVADEDLEARAMVPPERKPLAPPERKGGRA